MPGGRFLSIAEQIAEHLRQEIGRGRWSDTLPGVNQLAAELEVNFKTINASLRLLEDEGIVVPQGAGRRRRIVLPENFAPRALRVAILVAEQADRRLDYMVELQHQLVEAGHAVSYAPRTMVELAMDVRRIADMTTRTGADAWVVLAGSREVLEWFAAQPAPAFALFGRRRGLPVAGVGPEKPPAYAAATRRLIELGHRRIVLVARKARRLPDPGASERAFLNELAGHGLAPGPYNLPDWEETREGFHARLEALFDVTPPTALIIDEAPFFFATQQFLANRGHRVPGDVSLVCSDGDPHFAWCRPTVAHIRWDARPVLRRIVGWAANVSRGKEDVRQTLTKAEFVEGGTMGPRGTPGL